MKGTFFAKLPNILTISRVIATFLMVFYYYFGSIFKYEILFLIFVISSFSDFLDGYLSRKWNVVSNFGKCLDPISDKLLLITALFILVAANKMNLILGFLLMMREVVISGLREFLALQKISLPVSRLAKWKTGFQLTAVSMCFFKFSTYFIDFYLINFSGFLFLFPFTFIIQNIESIFIIVLSLAIYTSLHTGFVYIYNSRNYLK